VEGWWKLRWVSAPHEIPKRRETILGRRDEETVIPTCNTTLYTIQYHDKLYIADNKSALAQPRIPPPSEGLKRPQSNVMPKSMSMFTNGDISNLS
jgi:hypothetical protein